MTDKFYYHDNCRVKTSQHGAEFLGIRFCEKDEFLPERVSVYRYCVPGRCDTYNFSWEEADCGKVTYYTEGGSLSLPEALAMLAVDLELEPVRQMLVQAIEKPSHYGYARELVELLLPLIAPRTATLRVCRGALKKLQTERTKCIAVKRTARVNQEEK